MSKVVRISDEVFELIKSDAVPLEDTVDSVLKRWAFKIRVDKPLPRNIKEDKMIVEHSVPNKTNPQKGLNAKYFVRLWNLKEKHGVKHQLYHWEGTWFELLNKFPSVLIDYNGYVLFETENDYYNCPDIRITEQTNVPGGICSLKKYVKMR